MIKRLCFTFLSYESYKHASCIIMTLLFTFEKKIVLHHCTVHTAITKYTVQLIEGS